ncbi:MAG: hypothetical protein KAH72_04455, partial [Flavobacteriaceae bacterium]|nr:hypothetical protein [Flavobacteriaceae bacterium]
MFNNYKYTQNGTKIKIKNEANFTPHVAVYRLMQFTLRDIMIIEFGVKKTDEIFYLAGKKAGM